MSLFHIIAGGLLLVFGFCMIASELTNPLAEPGDREDVRERWFVIGGGAVMVLVGIALLVRG